MKQSKLKAILKERYKPNASEDAKKIGISNEYYNRWLNDKIEEVGELAFIKIERWYLDIKEKKN